MRRGHLGFSILPKDTSACRMGKTGFEPPTFWLGESLFLWGEGFFLLFSPCIPIRIPGILHHEAIVLKLWIFMKLNLYWDEAEDTVRLSHFPFLSFPVMFKCDIASPVMLQCSAFSRGLDAPLHLNKPAFTALWCVWLRLLLHSLNSHVGDACHVWENTGFYHPTKKNTSLQTSLWFSAAGSRVAFETVTEPAFALPPLGYPELWWA